MTKIKKFNNMSKLEAYIAERNTKLLVTDFDHKRVCKIEHEDGSKFSITNMLVEYVFFETKKDSHPVSIYIIYSEHHQPLMYFASDLVGMRIKKIKNL